MRAAAVAVNMGDMPVYGCFTGMLQANKTMSIGKIRNLDFINKTNDPSIGKVYILNGGFYFFVSCRFLNAKE
jgi:hypothetical protein